MILPINSPITRILLHLPFGRIEFVRIGRQTRTHIRWSIR